MKLKFSFLIALALVVATSGCHVFSRSKKPKVKSEIGLDVEADFRRRWIERRTTELTGKGTAAAAAQTQAEAEFAAKYPYLQKPRK